MVIAMQQISYPSKPVFQGRRVSLPKWHTDFVLFLQWVPRFVTTGSRAWQEAPQLSAKELEFIFGYLWLNDLSAQQVALAQSQGLQPSSRACMAPKARGRLDRKKGLYLELYKIMLPLTITSGTKLNVFHRILKGVYSCNIPV